MSQTKKVSISLIVFGACLLGIGLGLFGLNYWQASRCGAGSGRHKLIIFYIFLYVIKIILVSAHSHEEIEGFIDALGKRLLTSESQAIRNEIMINKVILAVQNRLQKLEDKKYAELAQQSNDEAVKIVSAITVL